MRIQINTDRHIEGHEALAARARGAVESALSRISDRISRVEVHLSDENGGKNGLDDKRCVMEARLEGRQPVAVTHHAQTMDQAFNGAAGKLHRMLESTLERAAQSDQSRDTPPSGPFSAEA